MGFDNRADAEETVRQRRAIAHNRTQQCERTELAAMRARARDGVATHARRRTGAAQPPLALRMMLIGARSGAMRTGRFAGARAIAGCRLTLAGSPQPLMQWKGPPF
jgi:hypothetical protein